MRNEPGSGRRVGRAAPSPRRAGEVAFAPAVVVEIDGEAERDITVGHGAAHVLIHPGLIAAHIELEDFGVVVGECHGLNAGGAHGAQHVHDTEARGGARGRQSAFCNDVLQRADRRQDHRYPQPMAQERSTRVDLLDVAQHPRAKGQRVDGDAVAEVAGLGLGAAHQVVPGLAREVGLCGREELVQDGELRLLLHRHPP
jgi:hypothetical protein